MINYISMKQKPLWLFFAALLVRPLGAIVGDVFRSGHQFLLSMTIKEYIAFTLPSLILFLTYMWLHSAKRIKPEQKQKLFYLNLAALFVVQACTFFLSNGFYEITLYLLLLSLALFQLTLGFLRRKKKRGFAHPKGSWRR